MLHVGVLLLAMCSGGATSPPATHDVSPVLLDEDLQTTLSDMLAVVSASSPDPSPALGAEDLQSMTGRLLGCIPNIEHVYGWVRDEFLVVQLSVPPGTEGVRLGGVHAARSVDGQP